MFNDKRAMFMGLLCSSIGLMVGIYVSITAGSDDYNYFFLYSAFSAFIVSYLFWHFLIERPQKRTAWRTLWAGGLSALVAHYVTFVILLYVFRFTWLITGEPSDLVGGPLVGFLEIPLAVLWPVLISLLFFGWITIPSGILIGLFYGRYLNRQQ